MWSWFSSTLMEQPVEQPFQESDGWLTRTDRLSRGIYWGIHASCLLVLATGAPPEALWLCARSVSR